MKRNRKFYVLVLISLISLAIMLVTREFQNDTFYSIKVGEQIFKTGIDMKEHFAFVEGLSYVYPHWLFDALVFLVYNAFGFFGIYVMTIVLSFLLLFAMYKTTSIITKDRGISLILTIFLGFGLKGFLTARAQLLSYILFILILYSIEMLNSTKKKKYILYIFLSSLLIANFHTATWPFVFILFLPYLVSDIIYYIVRKYAEKIKNYKSIHRLSNSRIEIEKANNFKMLLLTFILTIFTGFLTPQRFLPFTYLLKTKMGVTLANISEHLPITIAKRPEIFVILALLIFLLLLADMKINLKDFFLLGGLFLLSFLAKRNYALFVILSIFSIARILKLFIDKRVNLSIENILVNKYIMATLLVLFLTSAVIKINYEKDKSYVNTVKYPTELSDYIIEKLDYKNIRMYNEYNFGSYLLFRGIPVFIDSRADLYTEEFNEDCTIFKDAVINIFNNYEEIFAKYEITHVVIYNTNKLKSVLDKDDNYKKIYIDEHFTMYQKLT